MVYKTRVDPQGPTRHLGRRGALKQSTFVRLQKCESVLTVESALEVLLLTLLDLSNEVTAITYQPFTIDVANNRLFKTYEDLKSHRMALRDVGRTGIFYTPDIQATRQINGKVKVEVLEAKDSDWIPSEDDYYGQKLTVTKGLLGARDVAFNLYEASNRGLYQSALASNAYKLHCVKMQRENELGTLSDSYLEYLQHREVLLQNLSDGPKPIGELANLCSIEPSTVWHLLIDEVAGTDLNSKALGPSTLLHLNGQPNVAPLYFHSEILRLKTTAIPSTGASKASFLAQPASEVAHG